MDLGSVKDPVDRVWLAQGHQPGINVVFGSAQGTQTAIVNSGYMLEGGLGGYFINCALGDTRYSACRTITLANLKSDIDSPVALGVRLFYFDEPSLVSSDLAPCCSACMPALSCDASSVLYNAIGSNIIVDYIHSKYPGVRVGYSASNNNAAYYLVAFNNAAALGTPFHMDFVQYEQYESSVNDGAHSWAAFHNTYPNVIRAIIVEGIGAFCGMDGANTRSGNVDMVAFWNADNYVPWGYPIEDPTELQLIQAYAASGNKATVCAQSHSAIRAHRTPRSIRAVLAQPARLWISMRSHNGPLATRFPHATIAYLAGPSAM